MQTLNLLAKLQKTSAEKPSTKKWQKIWVNVFYYCVQKFSANNFLRWTYKCIPCYIYLSSRRLYFVKKKCQHRCTLLHNLFSARSMFCLRQSYAKINDKERYSFLVQSSLPIWDSFTFKILIIRNVIQIQTHPCLGSTEGSIFGYWLEFGANLGTVRSKDLVAI